MWWRLGAVIVPFVVAAAHAESPSLAEARRLLDGAEHEPARIDAARGALEAALTASPDGPESTAVRVELSHLYYVIGEVRAADVEARLAAFERGREVGAEAVARAEKDPAAHLWFAVNLGRLAEERGVMRSLLALSTIRRESATLLQIAPDWPDAHGLAGGLAARLPGFLGGDAEKAEHHLRRAIELDPHRVRFRLELAEFLHGRGRSEEARRHLETAREIIEPTEPLLTELRDRPLALKRLAEYESPR